MGISKGGLLGFTAFAVIGFGAGAAVVLLNDPDRLKDWRQPQAAPVAAVSAPTVEPAQTVLPTAAETVSTENQEVLASLLAAKANRQANGEAVTRTASTDLLGVAQPAQAAPAPTPEPEPEAPRVVAVADPAASAAFFNNAQANLAAQDNCGDDLRALAANAKVYFPSGGLSGSSSGLATARLIGQVARDCPGYTVQVEGHSDPSGDPNVNLRLSEQRAASVISRLASGGIDTSNMVAIGYGDRRPSGVTGTESDAFYDRRVEFSIVENTRQASLSTGAQSWQPTGVQPAASCAQNLQQQTAAARVFFSSRAITASPGDMETAMRLAALAADCEGVHLRVVGHFSDQPGSRETAHTGRLRALAMMSSLVASGFQSEQILIGAPSQSLGVVGQPGLPKSRIEFQVIAN